MRALLLILIMFSKSLTSFGQDTIFTISGDTILAEIIEYSDRITYTVQGKSFLKTISDSKVLKVTKDRAYSDATRNLITKTVDGCYFKKDEIGNKRILRTVSKTLHEIYNQKIIVSFEKVDSAYYLNFYYLNADLPYKLEITKGALLTFRLANNSKIVLKSADNYHEERMLDAAISKIIPSVNAKFSVLESDLKPLSESDIVQVTIELEVGSISHEPRRKLSNQILELARCINITK